MNNPPLKILVDDLYPFTLFSFCRKKRIMTVDKYILEKHPMRLLEHLEHFGITSQEKLQIEGFIFKTL